jgi:hypothetical protein
VLTNDTQGYELAQDEINMPLNRFRSEYTTADGSVEYVQPPQNLPRKITRPC